jgi:FixJ family two-component response regulator
LSGLSIVSVIDDDASVRIATARIVRSMDLIPYTFESCRDFLESPHFLNSSCIIADVQMPGMSGVELQAMLRSRGLTTPMIFITAYPDDRLRKRALDAGAVGFLHKPFQGTVIIECIERALGKSTGIPPSRR